VAAVSENENAVLVTVAGDFRRHIAPRIPFGARARFRNLSHIRLECPEPQAANRLKAAMSFVETEHALALASAGQTHDYRYRDQRPPNLPIERSEAWMGAEAQP
jgi:hypothetical protein